MRELILIVLLFSLGLIAGLTLQFTMVEPYNRTMMTLAIAAEAAAIGFFFAAALGWWYLRRLPTRSADGAIGVGATADALHTAVSNPSYVAALAPIARPWLDSAFPLLREGY